MALLDDLLHFQAGSFQQRLLLCLYIYVAGFSLYWTGQFIYRLWFHPLARFPGPFLCRVSYLYQMYFEAIKNGKMLERLPMLHEKYGLTCPPAA
jgi:hypothetical protein